jgi:hypothetical protein
MVAQLLAGIIRRVRSVDTLVVAKASGRSS